MQTAELVLCWVSPGHCHSVFVKGGSMRTLFGRGISQHTTVRMHIHTYMHKLESVQPCNPVIMVRTEVNSEEAGGERGLSQKAGLMV